MTGRNLVGPALSTSVTMYSYFCLPMCLFIRLAALRHAFFPSLYVLAPMAVLLLEGVIWVNAHNKLASSDDVSPADQVSSNNSQADLTIACNRTAGSLFIGTPLRNTLSSFFSALEQELLLDNVMELSELVELLVRLRELVAFPPLLCLELEELLETLRLCELVPLLRLLYFLPLVLRLLPMENAARWKLVERLRSSSSTIKRL